MQEIKRLGIISVAKISGVFGVILGLFAGIMLAVASSIAPDIMSSEELAAAGMGFDSSILVGPWAIVIFPIFYGVMYFVVGLISAALYNIFARWVGGVSVEFGSEKTTKAKKR
jgi:hypothetical protein